MRSSDEDDLLEAGALQFFYLPLKQGCPEDGEETLLAEWPESCGSACEDEDGDHKDSVEFFLGGF